MEGMYAIYQTKSIDNSDKKNFEANTLPKYLKHHYTKSMANTPPKSSGENSPLPRKQIFRALEAKSLRNRSVATRIADYLTGLSSTPTFLFLNIMFFVTWISLNLNIVPGFPAFDPYPFGLLTMAVSLEAIFLSIFVLVSQNRAAQTATLRDELNLRINLIAEREVTKILELLVDTRKKMKIHSTDELLDQMLKDVNAADLEQIILQQIERAGQAQLRRKLAKGEFLSMITSLVKTRSKSY
jgi:uncharacterized membrane protein